MKTTEKQIIIRTNRHRLYGMLHLPDAEYGWRYPAVIICHGFISNKNGQHSIFVKTARALSKEGFAVLRFDFSGCGESSGEHKDITLTRQIEEAISAVDFAAAHPSIDRDRIILLGHSLGGAVASAVAARDSRISKLALWAPVARPHEDIIGGVGYDLYRDCLQNGEVEYQGFKLGRSFFQSLSEVSPLEEIKEFSGDVFIAHGSKDADTLLLNAYLYGRALNARQWGTRVIRVVEGADHTFASSAWEREVIGLTLNWLAPGRQEIKERSLAQGSLVCC
jgi:uncharacterized protein